MHSFKTLKIHFPIGYDVTQSAEFKHWDNDPRTQKIQQVLWVGNTNTNILEIVYVSDE